MTSRVPAPRRADPFKILSCVAAGISIIALYPVLDLLLNR